MGDAVKKYRPSNGTEGEGFISYWCANCVHEKREDGRSCDILTRTMVYGVDEPEYPEEWQRDESGAPKCTAFQAPGSTPRCPNTEDLFYQPGGDQ